MRSYLVSDHITEHIARTPEGFLVCSNVVLCRTGQQEYRRHEIYGDGSAAPVTVHRSSDAVLDDRHIASLEGKPITGPGHPPVFLTPQNVATWQRGHVQNIRVGKLPSGEGCLIGDLVVTDSALIDQILNRGLREVSTGYECHYAERNDGDLDQEDFVANHVALVPAARANAGRAPEVRIMDGGHMTADADTSAKNVAALSASYADAINQAGSRMRREKDCRPSLRRAAEDAAEPTIPELSLRQRLDAFERSEKYAEECRKLWRKSSPTS